MSRTFHHSSRNTNSRTTRPQMSRRDQLAEVLADLSDDELTQNKHVWSAAPQSQSKVTMLHAINVTLTERQAA